MCDVTFITPNMGGDMAEESIGTLQLATILKEKGVSCDILQFFRIGDVNDFENFLDNAMKMLEERQPKIVSFYTRCDTYHIDLRLAERIKERWNDVYVVCGGPQSDITAEETIRQIPQVDFICCGEGETTIYPFFSSLLRGEPDLSVPGLVYRDGGKAVKNPRPELIENLDELPFIDYSLMGFVGEGTTKKKVFSIDVGRGCPFGCTFCSTKSFWGRKYRLKSPQRIYEEVKAIHEKFGKTRFNFSHDMFTLNRDKVIETCELMRTLDFPIEWGCSARVDCVDHELIDVMADSGMKGIYFGIETGSPRMQKLINKRLKIDNVVDIIEYMKSKGLEATTSFIYGFPEETEEDISLTMSLIGKLLNLKSVNVQTHLCAFMVGTELAERYKEQMTPVANYSDQTGEFAVEECKDLIEGHPELFQQMQEYKTELRTKLQYFPRFFSAWQSVQPVYQYISEKYPENRMIDMYYDFVEANQELLEKAKDLSVGEWNRLFLQEDKLSQRFADDENFDIISDIYRLKNVLSSEEINNGGTNTDIYCFEPSCMKKYASLREYPRCVAVVTCTKNEFKTAVI